jgi:hypothetical protein
MLAGVICLTVGITALSVFVYCVGFYIGGKNAGRIIFREMSTDQFEAIAGKLLNKTGK